MFLNPTDYARHKGVHTNAVLFALQQGRIRRAAGGMIDVEQADADWDSNVVPTVDKDGQTAHKPDADPEGPVPSQPVVQAARGEFMRVRTQREREIVKKENIRVKLQELEYAKKLGLLVERDKVEREAFTLYRSLRDACLNIPERVAGLLAVEGDEAAIYRILRTEIEVVFRTFAQQGSQQADQETEAA